MTAPVVGTLCCAGHMGPSTDQIGRWKTVRLTLDPTPRQVRTMEIYCLLDRRAFELAMTDGAASPSHDSPDNHSSESRQHDVAAVLASIGPPGTPADLDTKSAVISSAFHAAADSRRRRARRVPTRSSRRPATPQRRSTPTRTMFRLHVSGYRSHFQILSYRRVCIGPIASIRIHTSAKRLADQLKHPDVRAVMTTVHRKAHRWYASILIEDSRPLPTPAARQKRNGTVGVDLGVMHLATLSNGETIPNPRIFERARQQVAKASQAVARSDEGSQRHRKSVERLRRRHHEIAERRKTVLHTMTRQLATSWSHIAIEDLNVRGMTASARGTIENPGRNIRAKSGLNRALRDVSPWKFRQQITYKSIWYGSELVVCSRWFPSSKRCSRCGTIRRALPLKQRIFRCATCKFTIDRDLNAAMNLASRVGVAWGARETENARKERIITNTAGVSHDAASTGRPRGDSSATLDEQSSSHLPRSNRQSGPKTLRGPGPLTSRKQPDWTRYHNQWLLNCLALAAQKPPTTRARWEAVMQSLAQNSERAGYVEHGMPVVAVGSRALAIGAKYLCESVIQRCLLELSAITPDPPIALQRRGRGLGADRWALQPVTSPVEFLVDVKPMHPAWHFVGAAHMPTYELIRKYGPTSPVAIISATNHIGASAAYSSFNALERWGLITRRPRYIALGPTGLDDILDQHDHAAAQDAMLERHRRQRVGWRKALDLIEYARSGHDIAELGPDSPQLSASPSPEDCDYLMAVSAGHPPPDAP